MSQEMHEAINRVAKAIQELPEESRDVVLAEIEDYVAAYVSPQMTDAQHAEVARRLALPRRHVPQEQVRAVFRRFASGT